MLILLQKRLLNFEQNGSRDQKILLSNQTIKISYYLISTLGGDLELSLEVGKVWDRCRWFLYEHHADYQYCSFDLDSDKGTAKVRFFPFVVFSNNIIFKNHFPSKHSLEVVA